MNLHKAARWWEKKPKYQHNSVKLNPFTEHKNQTEPFSAAKFKRVPQHLNKQYVCFFLSVRATAEVTFFCSCLCIIIFYGWAHNIQTYDGSATKAQLFVFVGVIIIGYRMVFNWIGSECRRQRNIAARSCLLFAHHSIYPLCIRCDVL